MKQRSHFWSNQQVLRLTRCIITTSIIVAIVIAIAITIAIAIIMSA
jgi:hypothetical protein